MNPSEHWKNMHKIDLDPANQKKNKMHYESVKKHAAMQQSNQVIVSAKYQGGQRVLPTFVVH